MSKFDLVGLDGANPLGFLAALGTLRTATTHWKEYSPRMGWSQSFGGWRPYLEIEDNISEEPFIEGLNSELQKMKDHQAFKFADNFPVSAEKYRDELVRAVRASDGRVLLDFLAAFGSETIKDDKGNINDTAIRCSGAARQLFFVDIRTLVNETNTRNLKEALIKPWAYQDDKPNMRWDPNDDRRYALRWKNPSPDKIKTVRGANRLAIEGMPLLPTIPVSGQLETTGFMQNGRKIFWTWPIWAPAVSIDIVRSLLSLNELQTEKPDRRILATRGIIEIFRCQRIKPNDKYRNFTPAVPV
jgi:hypothetical protein